MIRVLILWTLLLCQLYTNKAMASEEIYSTESLLGQVLGDNSTCRIGALNVTSRGNRPPRVTWSTGACTGNDAVSLSTQLMNVPANCAGVLAEPSILSAAKNGDLYLDELFAQIRSAQKRCAEYSGLVLITLTAQDAELATEDIRSEVFSDPTGGTDCRVDVLTASEGIGAPPVITWQSSHCSDAEYKVDLLAQTVHSDADINCIWRDEAIRSNVGVEGVVYLQEMLNGWVHPNGKECSPIQELDVTVRLQHRQNWRDQVYYTDHVGAVKYVRAVVSDFASNPVQCELLGLSAIDGTNGILPELWWNASGCETVEVRATTIDPLSSACRLDQALYSERKHGQEELIFMSGGFPQGHIIEDDINHPPPGNASQCNSIIPSVRFDVTAFGDGVTHSDSVTVTNYNDDGLFWGQGDNESCQANNSLAEVPSVSGLVPRLTWDNDCAGGREVRILASVGSGGGVVIDNKGLEKQSDVCTFSDLTFVGGNIGPKAAQFMRTGYFDYQSGENICFARRANFKMAIVDRAAMDRDGYNSPWIDPRYVISEGTSVVVDYNGILEPHLVVASCRQDPELPCEGEAPGGPTSDNGITASLQVIDFGMVQVTASPQYVEQVLRFNNSSSDTKYLDLSLATGPFWLREPNSSQTRKSLTLNIPGRSNRTVLVRFRFDAFMSGAFASSVVVSRDASFEFPVRAETTSGSLPPRPDLDFDPGQVYLIEPAVQGEMATIGFHVINGGPATSASFQVEAEINGQTESFSCGPLASNATCHKSFSWFPVDGEHTLYLYADTTGIVAEESETNNTHTQRFVIGSSDNRRCQGQWTLTGNIGTTHTATSQGYVEISTGARLVYWGGNFPDSDGTTVGETGTASWNFNGRECPVTVDVIDHNGLEYSYDISIQ